MLKNALTLLLESRRAAGRPIRDLTESNPTRVGLAYPEEELCGALADRRALVYEPAPRGLPAARAAVAAEYARAGHAVNADDLVLTASTSEAYAYLFKLLCRPGDVVLAPAPSYPLFEHLTALEHVALRPYPLGWDGEWHVELGEVERIAAAEPRARAILVVNPNNPTGSYLRRAEHDRLQALAARRGLAVVSDEVFADYPLSDAPAPARVPFVAGRAAPALSFSLGGLSKSCGLPQLKLGWIVAGGPAAARADALERLELVADAYLSVATPVQVAAPRLLELGRTIRAAIGARTRANRDLLAARLPAGGAIQALPAEAGWSAILRLPATRTDEELALALLRDHGTLVHPGYFFDLPAGTWLVVSLLPEPAVFAAGIDAILAA